MNKQIKTFFVAGCLFPLFCLTACGVSSPGGNPATVPDTPAETMVPVTVSPSAPQDTPVPQDVETAVQEADLPAPVEEAAPVQSSDQNQQSASDSFTGVMGTEFIVPEGFVQLDEIPNIGYQYTFWHPEYEVRIVVYEIAPGYIPEGAYETDYNIASKNPDVTYFNKGEKWFVQSGYNNNGEEIFYSKECATDNGLKTFWITYPTAKREAGDAITVEFEKNCRF